MCFVCERIAAIRTGRNPYFVKELDTGYVVLGDSQRFYGYTLFLCKTHAAELFDLEPAVKLRFLEEMSLVAEAAARAFGAQKMNYELLGNGSGGAHMHWHLFCRREGDPGGNGPVWRLPKESVFDGAARPDAQQLQRMRAALLEELDRLAQDGKGGAYAYRSGG